MNITSKKNIFFIIKSEKTGNTPLKKQQYNAKKSYSSGTKYVTMVWIIMTRGLGKLNEQ